MQARAAAAARCQASSTDRTHLFYILRGLLKMDKRKTWNQIIFQYDSFQVSLGGSGEIRTHEPLRVTAFRVRPVMTTSIRFQIKTPYIARYDSIYGVWWTGVDSNHRKLSWQIYSLLPLATREPVHMIGCFDFYKSSRSCFAGAGDGTWTRNLLITSQLLYRLSYSGKTMVPWGGIEPPTQGFSVPCSTDWAIKAKKWRPGRDSNPRPLAWQASVLTDWTTRPQMAVLS